MRRYVEVRRGTQIGNDEVLRKLETRLEDGKISLDVQELFEHIAVEEAGFRQTVDANFTLRALKDSLQIKTGVKYTSRVSVPTDETKKFATSLHDAFVGQGYQDGCV